MNAKDEKFIFQGVYNVLYGTVELLMVSADAAAVNGDTRTLSTDHDQVKVHFCKIVAEETTALSENLVQFDFHFSRQKTLSWIR